MNKNIIKLLLEEADEKKIKSLITKRVEELCKQREEELSYYTAPQIKVDGKFKYDYSAPKIKKVKNVIYKSTTIGKHGGSAYAGFIHPKYVQILLGGGLAGEHTIQFDDVEELYKMLIANLKQEVKNNTLSQEEIIFKAVTKTVFDYVGGQYVEGGDKERFSHLELDGDDYCGKISSFKGTKHAMCVERAAIAHQLFKFIGIDSAFCSSHIERRGGIEAHAFNLIKINGKTVLFDPTLLDRSAKICDNAVVFDDLDEFVFDEAIKGISSLSKIEFPDREMTDKKGQKYILYYSKPKVDNVSV